MSLLYQVSTVIHSTLDSQEALQLIVSEAVRVMRASSGSLALINPTTPTPLARRRCHRDRVARNLSNQRTYLDIIAAI